MKRQIRVVMKNGFTFAFCCENMEIKLFGNELIGYSFDRETESYPMYIRMEDVDLIIDEGEAEEGE